MIKKIEDYLPYYIGQEVKGNEGTMTYTLSSVNVKWVGCMFQDKYGHVMWLHDGWKLVLRPLSDMTKEEREIFGWQEDWIFEDKSDPNQPLKTTFLVWEFIDLLKMGFDLFGLIPTGLAVDKTKEVTNATN